MPACLPGDRLPSDQTGLTFQTQALLPLLPESQEPLGTLLTAASWVGTDGQMAACHPALNSVTDTPCHTTAAGRTPHQAGEEAWLFGG